MTVKSIARAASAAYVLVLMVAAAPSATAGVTAGLNNYSEKMSAYMLAVARMVWSKARQVHVQNPAAEDDTLAVVVQVEGGKGTAFGVVDDSKGTGRPIVAQMDDLDGNGTVDEVCFLLPLKAHEQRTVTLLSAEAELPAAPCELLLREHTGGSWAPIRMQPTRSPGNTQMSTYRSPVNAARARKLMARLDEPVPMELVECDDFRVLIGKQSGLIEGMRPANIPKGLLGSYLREFVPDELDIGQMTRRIAGPVRCSFEWLVGKNVRRIFIYRNGVIESTWTEAPPHVQVIVCAYPYQYLQTGPRDTVRYSQMLEMRRDMPSVTALSFFGRQDASLRVEAKDLQAIDHQVWLDSGEIGWEVTLDAHNKISLEDPVDRVTRYTVETYIAGGMHLTSWKSEGGEAALLYRIGGFGAKALEAGTSLVRVTDGLFAARLPVVKKPVAKPAVSVVFEKTRMTVNRLYPNEINGWELRPITLAKHNPQPAYFSAELVNRSDKQATIEFRLEEVDWIHKATVLSEPEMLTHHRFQNATVPYFHSEAELVPGEATAVTVPADTSMPIEIYIRPKEETLGLLKCRLRCSDGSSANLQVIVRPTILFRPMFAPVDDVGRELANIGGPKGAALTYGVRFWGGYTPELTQWYDAAHRDAERKSFWTSDSVHLRGLAEKHGKSIAAGGAGVDLTAWSEGVLDVLRDPRYVDYRVRIYLHDEIHEVMGRRGRYVVPLSWMISVDRRIVMNSLTAAWPSFQEAAIDKPYQYHIKLPNDIAELFYYCGQDARLQEYAGKLVEPRRDLFDKWCADPGFAAGAGTDSPRQIMAFWISTQLHVAKYNSVRRQIWWLRHHGIDAFNSWAALSNYTHGVMHWMLMSIKSATSQTGYGRILTDRSLAWMDMKRDMELITLVRLLSEQVRDETTLRKLETLRLQALDASQRNEFEAARNDYTIALKLLRPDLIYLAPPDLYGGPIQAEALPDLSADDVDFHEAQTLP